MCIINKNIKFSKIKINYYHVHIYIYAIDGLIFFIIIPMIKLYIIFLFYFISFYSKIDKINSK